MSMTVTRRQRRQIPVLQYRSGMPKYDLSGYALQVSNLSAAHWEDLARIYPEIGLAGAGASFRQARLLTIMPVQVRSRQDQVTLAAAAHVLQREREGGVRLDIYIIGRGSDQRLVMSELSESKATVHIYRSNDN